MIFIIIEKKTSLDFFQKQTTFANICIDASQRDNVLNVLQHLFLIFMAIKGTAIILWDTDFIPADKEG